MRVAESLEPGARLTLLSATEGKLPLVLLQSGAVLNSDDGGREFMLCIGVPKANDAPGQITLDIIVPPWAAVI